MKRIIVVTMIALFAMTACTGSFKLTKTVNNIHRGQSEKWVDEVIFLGCVIFPVYSFAMLGDAIILNTVEFWTGKNPMASLSHPDGIKTILEGEEKVVMSYGDDTNTLIVRSTQSPEKPLILKKSDTGVRLIDETGNVVYTSSKDEAGGVSVFDKDMTLVKYYSPKEVLSKQL